VSEERLTGRDKQVLMLWIVAGIAGALFASKYYFHAFPEASVNFKVSRAESLSRAKQFVSGLGEDVTSYQSAIVFDVDDNAKTYLERELGLQQANRLMSSELNIWYWDVRFFKPQQEEEFRVRVNPAGEVVGYQHLIEEARPGAELARAAAQATAQNFLTSKRNLDLAGWELLPEEINSTKRPNRRDWSFTWEKRGFRAKDAPYRLQVGLQGDKIGGSDEFLKVPQAWERSYQQLRSANIFYNQVAIIPYILLMGSALWVAISLTRRGQANWMAAIKLGVLVAALFFLMQLNQWESIRANYDTHSSYSSFVALQLAIALLSAVGTALMVTLVMPGAEPLYRASQPNRLQLVKAFTLRGLRSKEFFAAAVVGLSLAAAHIGFIVAFYMFGSKVGVWAPQDLNYSDTINTSFPWIAGVAIGLMASTSEEFLFRLFAIPFLERLTKSRALAVILPAFSWSFLHSAYPQEPGYIRGVEVGLIGIVAGLVMLRWGILATLIWHYTVDASLVGLLLVRSNSMYFKVSGIIVGAAALAPLLFSGISYLARGKFEVIEDLLNRAEPAPEISLVRDSVVGSSGRVATGHRYNALTHGMIVFLVVCLVFGGLLVWRVKSQLIGDYLKLSVDARKARVQADETLRQRDIDSRSYYHAVVFADVTDPLTNEFLRQRIGVARLNDIYATRVPGALWRARYFRDSQPEEYAVILKPSGSLHSIHHTLAEDASGASLSKDQAVARAEQFLREQKQIDMLQWSLVESYSEKHPHRTDHTLTWEQTTPLDPAPALPPNSTEHAHARIELRVLGDEVSNYRTYIKIPEEWRRKQEELTLFRTIFNIGIPALFFGGLGLTALILFLKNLRSPSARTIPWRRIARWSSWGLVAYTVIFAFGNRIPTFLNAYQTAIPFKTMLGGIAIGALIGAPLYFGGIALLFGIAWYFADRAFGSERLPGWAGMPAVYYRDALCIGLGGTALLLGLNRLLEFASAYWPTAHRAAPSSFGGDFDAPLPAPAILASAVIRGLLLTGLVALIASFVAAQIKQPLLRLFLFLVGALAMVGNSWGTPADFIKQLLARLILLTVVVFGVRRVMRFNILGCFLVAAGTVLVGGTAEMFGQPAAFYRANGYALVLMLILLLAWPLLAWQKGAASGVS